MYLMGIGVVHGGGPDYSSLLEYDTVGYQCFVEICCLSSELVEIEPAGCSRTLTVTRLHGATTQKTFIGVGLCLTLWRTDEVLDHFLGCFGVFRSHSL